MSTWFPHGFHFGFLDSVKVSCFLCTESHKETRKLSRKSPANSGRKWFPRWEIFLRQETLCFHLGFLKEGSL